MTGENTKNMITDPTFTVFCGPMFSSKTTRLLSVLERFKYQHKRVAVFKPSIDDRYDSTKVVSHGGWSYPSSAIKVGSDILEALVGLDEEPHVIAVDEAFMIPGIAEVLVWLFRNGISVIVATLDISSTGKPFPEVEKLLIWATHVEKCSAVCTVCGGDASYTHKRLIDSDHAEVHVGGSDMYEPRCFRHHLAIDQREKIHDE